ncbi:hypothetical protein ZWY2020_049130 [Hordeum vulgare]|nr:hypothetical protein ZWY2020_019734 [Hordeum vulgare]KAI4975523.1 hypothetical protein ZWY2020_049130 [Hordeum vulgare]
MLAPGVRMPEAAAVKSKAVATEPMLIPAGVVASVLAAATVSLQTMERDPIGTGVMTEEDREVGSGSIEVVGATVQINGTGTSLLPLGIPQRELRVPRFCSRACVEVVVVVRPQTSSPTKSEP